MNRSDWGEISANIETTSTNSVHQKFMRGKGEGGRGGGAYLCSVNTIDLVRGSLPYNKATLRFQLRLQDT